MRSFDPSAIPCDEILIYEDAVLVYDGSDPASYITLEDAAAQWGHDLAGAADARGDSGGALPTV